MFVFKQTYLCCADVDGVAELCSTVRHLLLDTLRRAIHQIIHLQTGSRCVQLCIKISTYALHLSICGRKRNTLGRCTEPSSAALLWSNHLGLNAICIPRNLPRLHVMHGV